MEELTMQLLDVFLFLAVVALILLTAAVIVALFSLAISEARDWLRVARMRRDG